MLISMVTPPEQVWSAAFTRPSWSQSHVFLSKSIRRDQGSEETLVGILPERFHLSFYLSSLKAVYTKG